MKKICPSCRVEVEVDPEKEVCPKCGGHIPILPHEKPGHHPPPHHIPPHEIHEIKEKLDWIIERLPPGADSTERPPHEEIIERLERIEKKLDKIKK